MARIVLLGATGYTGRLAAEALVRDGARPLLVARSAEKLTRLHGELAGETDTALADVERQDSLRALLEPGDVMISTVGPFLARGDGAVQAAMHAGAHYLDSNGEPAFTRRVFEHHGPTATRAGSALLTAFGWENLTGNLAGALALRDAGRAAVRVDTGYFYTGRTGFSGGTRASFAQAMVMPSFAFRGGAIRTVRGAERYRTMPVAGEQRPAVGLGASEHFALPRSFPQLREVNAYLGWFGGLGGGTARVLHVAAPVGAAALSVPGIRPLARAVMRRSLRGSSGGPAPETRAAAGVHVVGIAYDAEGRQLSETHLEGSEGYELTGALLAWGARRVAGEGLRGSGALGPVEAFGLDELEAGCRGAGLARIRRLQNSSA